MEGSGEGCDLPLTHVSTATPLVNTSTRPAQVIWSTISTLPLCWHLGVSGPQPGMEDRPRVQDLLRDKAGHPGVLHLVTSHSESFVSFWISSTLPATPA